MRNNRKRKGNKPLTGLFLCLLCGLLLILAPIHVYKAEKNADPDEAQALADAEITVVGDSNGEENIPVRPYGTKISRITTEGIEFYWKKPENIDGYEVFRSYAKDSEFTCIAIITDPAQGTYLDSRFDYRERSVYYKIRSYVLESDGEKRYSKFSKVQEAKYRTELELEQTKLFLRSGAFRTLGAYYGWGDAARLSWSTSDSSIATVTFDGTIKGVSAGTCTITCYSESLEMTRSCTVVVDRQPMEKLQSTLDLEQEYTLNAQGYWDNPDDEDDGEALIMMVGDMMCTGAQQKVQGYETGEYNFNGSYQEVKDLLSSADLAVGNLETILSSTWPYMHEEAYVNNKANCNAPSRYLDAIKYAGMDGVVMANNHNCDADVQGLKETIEQVDRYDLAHTGVFRSSDDQRYMMFDVNGIKVGYVSYVSEVTGYNGKDEDWSKSDVNTCLNYYSKSKAAADIQEMKEAGADYVIVYMHWGVKNAQKIKPSQKTAAQELADVGADYIVGSHCHLLQKYVNLTAADGRTVPCFYSLGDFQSSIEQIEGNRDSAILRICLKRNADGTVSLASNRYIPCYTYTEYGGDYYVTVPVTESLSDYSEIHQRIVDAIGTQIEEYR